jgi:hypothetical protein
MKFDLMHLPGVTPPGCGRTYVDGRIGDHHERGDRVTIRCPYCRRTGDHEVRARLTGLA